MGWAHSIQEPPSTEGLGPVTYFLGGCYRTVSCEGGCHDTSARPRRNESGEGMPGESFTAMMGGPGWSPKLQGPSLFLQRTGLGPCEMYINKIILKRCRDVSTPLEIRPRKCLEFSPLEPVPGIQSANKLFIFQQIDGQNNKIEVETNLRSSSGFWNQG